ncbi:hypothetical protein PSTT_11977 [Puccinia striiformis]|uniref:mRNA decay factor PAT1 domain-containing protein n=1 Tax=Puccinia striiformis TaxID=27350 RepID=A0A2S4UXY7_9BASI|nr:hypothetical protein PSTT_11977 [Puccinia striiformis]
MASIDDPGGHYSLDRKLAQLRADFGEDIAVYDYADDGLVESTAGLEDDMNDFNDETFGMETVDRDFDFSGSTAQYLGVSEPPEHKSGGGASWTTMSSLLADREPSGSTAPRPSSPPRRKTGHVSLLEDPLLAPNSSVSHRHLSGLSTGSRPPGSAPAATISKPSNFRTLEDIEAEIRANSAAKNRMPPSALPPQAMTLEQVEAALLANHERKLASATASRSSTPHGIPFSQHPIHSKAPAVHQIQRNISLQQPAMSSPVMAPMVRATQTPSSLPPLNHPAHPAHPQHTEWLRLQQQQHQMYTNIPPQQQISMQPLLARIPVMHSPAQGLPSRHLPNPPILGFAPNMRTASVPPRSATHTPFVQSLAGTVPVEELRSAAEARIQEQERREALRRRKAAKIAEMSKYNNLMSQGDKDFITRIQVSQLVNPSHGQVGFDPYADDFYFHVYSAIRASRMASQQQAHISNGNRRAHNTSSDERISQDYDGIGGLEQDGPERSEDRRSCERAPENVTSLVRGRLGKISLRTRSAPRQMLQVQPNSSDDLTTAADKHWSARHASTADLDVIGKVVFYSVRVEQLRRTQPNAHSNGFDMDELNSQLEEWEAQYGSQKDKIWKQLRVLDPLGISNPFKYSLYSSLLSKLSMSYPEATLLDLPSESSFPSGIKKSRAELELETELFMNCVVAPMMAVINEISLDLVTGLVSLLMSRNDLMVIARSKMIYFSTGWDCVLTLFLSRAELLRSAPSLESNNDQNESTTPSHESVSRWQGIFNQLFQYLSSDFPSLFPSTRLAGALLSTGSGALDGQSATDSLEMNQTPMRSGIDLEDEPVWQLMAALAVSTDSDGQQTLVGGLRGKVLENVIAASKKSVPDQIGALKIVGLFPLLFLTFSVSFSIRREYDKALDVYLYIA